MAKCENCEREYDDGYSFCPYCGEEKKEKVLSDEERVKRVLPVLKEAFEEVTTVGVESVMLKIDEQRSLLVNTMDKLENLTEKIEDALNEPVEETSMELIPEIVKEDERVERRMEKRRDVVQALSLITLTIGVVSVALSLILPFVNGLSGLTLISSFVQNSVGAFIGSVDLAQVGAGEIMQYVACWWMAWLDAIF